MILPVDTDAIEARWAKTTPAPWTAFEDVIEAGRCVLVAEVNMHRDEFAWNLNAIAHAPSDIAALIAEVKRMRPAFEAVEKLRLATVQYDSADERCEVSVAKYKAIGMPIPLDEAAAVINAFEDAMLGREQARRALLALATKEATGG